ncbi:MAG: aldehyde dehydrogenase [Betaproteobacteria bacterium]|nr:aldehyde dehydrogenase [Betaproteobacteria bacterium]
MSAPRILDRRAMVGQLLRGRGDALLVTGLGGLTSDVYGIGDHPFTFYLWGVMGGAAMVGLGLALAQPSRRVVVLTGDGEMLMGMGALATIGVKRPANLSIVVIDNGLYAETGLQDAHTSRGVDLAAVARACGIAGETVQTQEELDAFERRLYTAPGPVFAAVKVPSVASILELPARDGPYLRSRFRTALLGEGCHL